MRKKGKMGPKILQKKKKKRGKRGKIERKKGMMSPKIPPNGKTKRRLTLLKKKENEKK